MGNGAQVYSKYVARGQFEPLNKYMSPAFRQRFEEKGRFKDYLSSIPSWIITASTPALVGASRALDLIPVA